MPVCSNNNFIKVANQRIEPLYKGGSVMEIQEIEKMILDARSFISAVVFSGGEPTTQYDALEHLARFAKEQGYWWASRRTGIILSGFQSSSRKSCLIKYSLISKRHLMMRKNTA